MDRLKRMARRRKNRAHRVRNRVQGTAEQPRLSIHRTAKHFYAQAIDDLAGRTLYATSSQRLKLGRGSTMEAAKEVGSAMASLLKEGEIERVGFDRGSFRYHGRVKAFADAVREGGVKF